ncbi:hypothetical protein NpPPO83_00006647 [Neofusicoccum parvum]|uniref:Uncharacterized protein n=1 Tax=Neofusicoccum parvum TaxID=310453 RepID=A0ACB5SA62_9PEZI|nr:hypothetical protein NpPPO83_00006647 [Neofusicoccum parvum]
MRIAHGDIRAESIIVDGTSTYLIDFGYAIAKATRSADRWRRAQQDDYDCTAEVFSWAASEAAIRSVTHLLDRPRPLGMTQADQQTLADHLLLIQASIPDLIHAIQLAVPAPTPALALALATRLARGSTAATREAAIAVLLDALARGELADYDLLCRMKKLAATTAGLLETFSIGPYRVGPGAVALYQEAADALRGRPAHRPALLQLQLKRAKFLAGREAWDAALQVWLDVLAELGEGRKEGDFKIARELAWAMSGER